MKKGYAILNLILIVALINWNYIANSMGINGNTVGSLSDEYDNLFTPAGYAFSIWGLIFLALLGHGIFQLRRAYQEEKPNDFILQMGPWLIIANLANIAWVWFWLQEYTGLTVLLMGIILFSLIMVIKRLDMERWDAPLATIIWVWWPICLYSGWIAVAMIANVAAYLSKIGWNSGISEVTWTMIMITVATLVNLWMIRYRNMREFAGVGLWALIAIAIRHWDAIPALQWSAMSAALILFIAIAEHGYRNRATNPFKKWQEGEKLW